MYEFENVTIITVSVPVRLTVTLTDVLQHINTLVQPNAIVHSTISSVCFLAHLVT
jgi:hypothetical protein